MLYWQLLSTTIIGCSYLGINFSVRGVSDDTIKKCDFSQEFGVRSATYKLCFHILKSYALKNFRKKQSNNEKLKMSIASKPTMGEDLQQGKLGVPRQPSPVEWPRWRRERVCPRDRKFHVE